MVASASRSLPPGLQLSPCRFEGQTLFQKRSKSSPRNPDRGGMGSSGSQLIFETYRFPWIKTSSTMAEKTTNVPQSFKIAHKLRSCFGDSGSYFQ